MPKFPEDPAFVTAVCREIEDSLLSLTCEEWTVLPCPLLRIAHVAPPDPSERTVLVSEVAIRRLLVRKFYRPLQVKPLLLTRRGLVSDVTMKVIQRSFNKPPKELRRDRSYQCPLCGGQFTMSKDTFVIKQCPTCERWLARGAYQRVRSNDLPR